MMIHTSRFGEIEVDEGSIITFDQGIPGFEEMKRYVLICDDNRLPFAFLQSVEDGNLAFVLTDPFAFYPDYAFDLPEDVREQLSITKEQEVSVWSIVSVRENILESTINLLAPIVINNTTKLAQQAVLHGSVYQTRHPLMEQTTTRHSGREAHAGLKPQEG